MKNKRIFVSGGAGVIGMELVPRLIALGHAVLVGDLKPRPAAFGKNVLYIQGDLNLLALDTLETFQPEIFIHLAATFERSTETSGFWDENFWHNISLSHHLMTLGRDLISLRRVVFASSYLIYDSSQYQFSTPQDIPVSLNESLPVSPRNLTGMAKFGHEIELKFLSQFEETKFSIVSARIYRGYGRNSRDVISRWIRMLLAGEAIEVYRPEGLFDFIYAADSAQGLIHLALNDNAKGIINLGTGTSRKVSDVVDVLRQHFPDMEAKDGDANIDFEASQADMTLFEKIIGWRPEYTLETAIPEMILYEKQQLLETSSNRNMNVLVSSASRKIPLIQAVQKAMRNLGQNIKVVAGDVDDNALAQYVADEFWVMPKTDIGSIEALLEGCKQRKIGFIIPTRDGELLFWSQNAEVFRAAEISVMVSAPAAINRCLDKFEFANFGKDHGFPFIPASLSIDELECEKFVVKKRFGAGSFGVGINLDRKAAVVHAGSLNSPIFQPFIKGMEISIDAYITLQNDVKGLVLRRRDLVENGESRITSTFRNANIEEQCKKILTALELKGPVVMQCLIDETGSLFVVECNARFGGASTTGIRAGLDPFYWGMIEASGEDLESYTFNRVANEIRQIRVAEDVYIHDTDF